MTSPIDFESLFDIAPNAYMVLDAELRYVAANEAYLEATASRREQLIGQHIFDLFPNDPGDPSNVPAQMLRRSLERVLATGERDHLAFIPYRVPKRVGERVVVEERYWSATHCPLRDASGRVTHILQHTVDVTDLHRTDERASAPGEQLRQGAGVLSRARAVQEDRERAEAEREYLRELFDQAPGFMCFLEGTTHVFRLANEAYLKLVGHRDIVGKPVAEALPEVIEQGFPALLDKVYGSGERFVGEGVRLLLQQQPGGPAEEVFLDFIYQPVKGPDGRARGIFVQGHDVTSTKRAEREREAALRAAEAFSEELKAQSQQVALALEKANARITQLEAQLAAK